MTAGYQNESKDGGKVIHHSQPIRPRIFGGHVTAYQDNDCTKPAHGRKTIGANECVSWTSNFTTVGISWGGGIASISTFQAYSDEECKTEIGGEIKAADYSFGMVCVNIKPEDGGWKSVRAS